ncbi:50S ribosomal protein L21 [Candidatus Mycoplasma haematohominis]|uniref:50S ribosomal protein L21 n=1 Tax=Candidatus Mycoplasma haematohominis TaxID=1494318 RepID=A0A478FPV4_9MOLU|nr:50S ribosomal protein L21 [Candidatus Mycoplasma haemohominis]GCE63433.1 50S ribosomal protein L21 [Candidatus Mycoplasma haemohominis]
MFAYFCVAGKQYIAKKGDILVNCPFVRGDIGDIFFTEQVLGINDTIGSPAGQYLSGAKIELKIVKQGLSKKLRIVNFRPQKRHEKWKGHRTKYTNLEVMQIYWSK